MFVQVEKVENYGDRYSLIRSLARVVAFPPRIPFCTEKFPSCHAEYYYRQTQLLKRIYPSHFDTQIYI